MDGDGALTGGDALGPERRVFVRRPEVGLDALVVVDNVALGVAIGGVRMATDVGIDECRRLARAMTLKNAMAGLPHGGGKAVIRADPALPRDAKERLVRAFAQAIRDVGDYVPGPDMGTDETCMAWIRDETGRAVGLPRVLGGIPLDEIGATGLGLAVAAEVAAPRVGLDLGRATVAIQGYGAVGRHTARRLRDQGARIVAVADRRSTALAEAGLDLEALDAVKAAGGTVGDAPGVRSAPAAAILDAVADIFVPAARPDVLDEARARALGARLVLQGANIPATAAAEAILHQRGILSVPDFVANAGGVICAAVEHRGGSEAEALATVAEKIRRNVTEVLDAAGTAPPRQAALALATARVEAAARFRRFR